ncbi:MAG: stage II sporulation protein M [Candidatus Nanoarchaeia archaeon]
MVLERLIAPEQIEGHPWELFFVGALYSNIALIAAYILVQQFSSLTTIAFTVILTLPFVYYSLNKEEDKYKKLREETDLLKTHALFFQKFMYLFLGFTVTFMAWYTFAPQTVIDVLFYSQVSTVRAVNSAITGQSVAFNTLITIVAHNIQVLLVCVMLSFFFGSGAIYILTWNASVLGVGMGTKLREALSVATREFGLVGYFSGAHLSFLAYLIHGIPEVLSYIVGGILGGTLSFAYVKRELHGDMAKKIFEDMFIMLAVAIGLLFIAGMLEVYVSPYFL